MDRERIEARCRVANWATIMTGVVALSSPVILLVEAIAWLIERRWPTLARVTGWTPAHLWLRALSFLPTSAIVLLVGGAAFLVSLGYWRSQEQLRRRIRAPLHRPARD